MNCPTCQTPIPPGARFCGVCGHQLQAPAPRAAPASSAPPARAASVPSPLRAPSSSPAPAGPAVAPAPAAAQPGSGVNVPSSSGAAAPRPAGARMPSNLKPVKREDPFLGLTLNGRFKIESKLGEGGFGAVYKGTQVQTGRKVALKLLHPEMTRDENLVARFRREGLVLCNLRDPHTITTYDFDATPDGTLYIAMELLEGKSLHQVFHSEAPIAWARVLKIVSQMCSSLGEAHKQNIVHRDLKPENIYLEDRGGDPEFVKILDFGIAKVMRGDNSVDPQAPQLTATGQTLGTLEYMSPEQLMGKQLDGRSDVYALGVLMYELLTGRLPFPEAKGPAALITAQLKQTPKPPSVAHPQGDIPPGVDRIVLKALEKNKDHRFQEVGALAHAATDCIASGGVWPSAREESGPMRLPSSPGATQPRPGGSAPNLAVPPSSAAPAPARSGGSSPNLPMPPQQPVPARSGGSSPNLRMPPQQPQQAARSDGSAPHRLPSPPVAMPSPPPMMMAPSSGGSGPRPMPSPAAPMTPPPMDPRMASPFAPPPGMGGQQGSPGSPGSSDPRLAPAHAGASGPMQYPMAMGPGPRGPVAYAQPVRSRATTIWVTIAVLVAAVVIGAALAVALIHR